MSVLVSEIVAEGLCDSTVVTALFDAGVVKDWVEKASSLREMADVVRLPVLDSLEVEETPSSMEDETCSVFGLVESLRTTVCLGLEDETTGVLAAESAEALKVALDEDPEFSVEPTWPLAELDPVEDESGPMGPMFRY